MEAMNGEKGYNRKIVEDGDRAGPMASNGSHRAVR